jgi:TetR/AcrR family transcriptional regulator, transcriptional repressor for nem operon
MRDHSMKKSKAETAETRQTILDAAARAFRANGIQATSLADLMAEAGLSHGGFYRHFNSKDQLVAQACASSLASLTDALEAQAHQHGFKAIVEGYLSAAHRDSRADGCPLASLGSELARADAGTRAAAAQGFARMADVMARHIGRRSKARAQSEAAFALAAMIGAVTMARIIDDPQISSALLDDVRQHLDAI